jgi:hypothetical protein
MRRGLDEDQRGMAESQRRRQKAIDDDLRGAEEGRKRIQRAIDEDMKYARRGNDDEMVNDLLSRAGSRINDDGPATAKGRARSQTARAQGGSAQSSRSSGGSSGKRSLSTSQIKAIYARGDD